MNIALKTTYVMGTNPIAPVSLCNGRIELLKANNCVDWPGEVRSSAKRTREISGGVFPNAAHCSGMCRSQFVECAGEGRPCGLSSLQ
jgi:hypothetical protein